MAYFFNYWHRVIGSKCPPPPRGWHMVQPVSRASLCGALFFVILEPKSDMVRAHKLQLDHGQYCGSILGLSLSYMQPTVDTWW